MDYIKTFENYNKKIFYHGSYDKLPIKTILKSHEKSYTRDPNNMILEGILEKYRPDDKLSRYDSIFLVDDPELIDAVGAPIDYIYEVIIPGNITPEKSDLAWYSEIEGEDDIEKQKEYALNYWNGIPYYDKYSSAFEYRVKEAIIYELYEEN